MKRLTGSVILTMVLIGLVSFSGCGKYEDGPGFSLTTKTARLVGEWKVITYNGNQVTTPYVQEFMEDGSFSQVITVLGVPITYTGTWEFTSGKEAITVKIQGTYEDLTITRLTADELWYKDSGGVVWQNEKQ